MQARIDEGLSIKDYCLQKGICQNTYFYWQRRVRLAACKQLALKQPETAGAHSFAEVKVIEPPAAPAESTAGQIILEIRGCRITADRSYPAKALAALLRELKC